MCHVRGCMSYAPWFSVAGALVGGLARIDLNNLSVLKGGVAAGFDGVVVGTTDSYRSIGQSGSVHAGAGDNRIVGERILDGGAAGSDVQLNADDAAGDQDDHGSGGAVGGGIGGLINTEILGQLVFIFRELDVEVDVVAIFSGLAEHDALQAGAVGDIVAGDGGDSILRILRIAEFEDFVHFEDFFEGGAGGDEEGLGGVDVVDEGDLDRHSNCFLLVGNLGVFGKSWVQLKACRPRSGAA